MCTFFEVIYFFKHVNINFKILSIFKCILYTLLSLFLSLLYKYRRLYGKCRKYKQPMRGHFVLGAKNNSNYKSCPNSGVAWRFLDIQPPHQSLFI